MKRVDRLIIAVFIVTCVIFGIYTGSSYMSRDTEGPVITMKKDTIEASIEDSDKTLLKGIKAEDKKDGDVSDSLIIESMQMGEDGACTVVCAAFDRSNNVSKASRTVNFTDYRPIHFNITQPLRFPAGSSNQILKYITASDCIDGDITNRVKLTQKDEEADYTGAGIFDYQIEAVNSLGDRAVLPVSVEYYTDSYEERLFHPNLYLKKYLVYISEGSTFDPKNYLDSVGIGNNLYAFDENITGEESESALPEGSELPTTTQTDKQVTGAISYDAVSYQSNVKTDKAGTYTVEYSCTTKKGYTGTTQMIVVVE